MRFARGVFLAAGVVGILVVLPLYFLEAQMGRDYPPAINHPEFYYGFVGVTLAWQVLYLLVALDPVRLRPVMPMGMLAKGSFVVALVALYLAGRVSAVWFGAVALDGTFAVLFALAYWRTGGTSR